METKQVNFPSPTFCRIEPGEIALPSNQIHVWRVNLDQSLDLSTHLVRLLDGTVLDEIQYMARPLDRSRRVAARIVLRVILSCYVRMPPQALRFSYGPHGKLELDPHQDRDNILRFNLSHSGCLALLVVTMNKRVGLDVERHRAIPDLDSLARHVLTPAHRQFLQGLPSDRSSRVFLEWWIKKEALAKARGSGVGSGRPMTDVPAVLETERMYRLWGDENLWHIEVFTPAPRYLTAVAYEGEKLKLTYLEWSSSIANGSGRKQ